MLENKICEYGCNKIAVHQMKNGKWCCSINIASCPAIKEKQSKRLKQEYTNGKRLKFFTGKSWNRGLTKETDNRILKIAEKNRDNYITGKTKHRDFHHSEEAKERLSKIRSEQLSKMGSGGFLKIKWYRVKNLNGEDQIVRGTWELFIAEYLNDKQLEWERGRPIEYLRQDGSKHRYSPDFFLKESGKYIEVKGYFSEKDKNKLELVVSQTGAEIIFINGKWLKSLKDEKTSIFNIPIFSSTIQCDGLISNLTEQEKKDRLLIRQNLLKSHLCSSCNTVISRQTKTGLCSNCYFIYSRKVRRPDKETLRKELSDNSLVALGIKYGVCGNSIKKWAKGYGISIPLKRKSPKESHDLKPNR